MSEIHPDPEEIVLARIQVISSLKPPDLRWRQVQCHLHSQSLHKPVSPIRDPLVRHSIKAEIYRRNQKENGLPPNNDFAHIFTAIQLGDLASVMGDLVRAYLLAGLPTSHVATLVRVHDDVIVWFERLFFNVQGHLGACDWIQAHILVPADQAMDEYESGSLEFEQACDRAVLFYVAYTGGMEFLRRVVRPAAEVAFSSIVSPLNNSPYVRILRWLWSAEISLPTYVDILERYLKLMKNSSTFSGPELDHRMERLWKFTERQIRKRPGRNKQNRRVRKTKHKQEGANSDFLTQWLNDLMTGIPRESGVDSRAQSES